MVTVTAIAGERRERLLTRAEAAGILGLRTQTLAKWAMDGRNLSFIRVGKRAVRYRLSDIMAFLERHTQGAEAGA